ncbi:Aldo/keto reductase [Aspergillus pseudoustus]|uniref:Aldo/keto reductase n=1 Tax=Aspergillus pseudoustus TaxID=1810923 RepID=A0ABR4IG82_9EURO
MKPIAIPPSLQSSKERTKVAYKQVGTSGLRVSVPILGTMAFGLKTPGQPWLVDDETAIMDLLEGAYNRGLNTWDTANVYSGGWNEKIIGRTLRERNIPRHKVTLLTKIGMYVSEDPGVNPHMFPWMSETVDFVNQGGLSRTAIFNAVQATLERMQTDYIDLLQIHRYDPSVRPEETMKALHDLVEAGKVRYIGACSMWTYQFQEMQNIAERNGWTKFISMQNQYSLCYREEEREMIKYCKMTGVGILSWSPLYRGLLARPVDAPPTTRGKALKSHPVFKYMDEGDEAIINRVSDIAVQNQCKMSQVALAWLVQKGSVPITGMATLARIDDAAATRDVVLSETDLKYLEELYQPKPVSGHY